MSTSLIQACPGTPLYEGRGHFASSRQLRLSPRAREHSRRARRLSSRSVLEGASRSGLRQRHSTLPLVLAATVLIGGRAHLVRLEEKHLRYTLVGVDLGRKRCGVGELERDVTFPLGLQRRYVDYAAATRVRA